MIKPFNRYSYWHPLYSKPEIYIRPKIMLTLGTSCPKTWLQLKNLPFSDLIFAQDFLLIISTDLISTDLICAEDFSSSLGCNFTSNLLK